MIHQEGNDVNVRFFEKAKGIAPGQSAVFYEGNDVIGGGIIQRPMEKGWSHS
jgi:tRNA-specific 2-thiouridylase